MYLHYQLTLNSAWNYIRFLFFFGIVYLRLRPGSVLAINAICIILVLFV